MLEDRTMKTNELSLKLSQEDFPKEMPQLWVKLRDVSVCLVISKHGISLTAWISKTAWPDTKVTKKTLRY